MLLFFFRVAFLSFLFLLISLYTVELQVIKKILMAVKGFLLILFCFIYLFS